MTVHMKALKTFVYAGKRLHAGDEFDARGKMGRPGSDATVLDAIRHAKPCASAPVAPVVAPRSTYQHRMMTAAAPRAAAVDDGLDALDAAALHALAAERGIKLHHMTGAAKVRAALRAP